MGKGENLYVNEFIDYYMNLGVDHIFIYDDNDINILTWQRLVSTKMPIFHGFGLTSLE